MKIETKPMGGGGREVPGEPALGDDAAAAQRARQIEAELQRLGAQYLALDEPTLLERAAKCDYKDARVANERATRESHRRELEETATKLIVEHGALRKRDAAIPPLEGDNVRTAELRARLQERRMRRGRFQVLIKLPASPAVTAHRLRTVQELEEEIAHLESVIRRIEPQPDNAGE